MRPSCPSQQSCSSTFVVRDGHFWRACQSRWIQRFKCRSCGKKFSHATGTLEFGQRKRRVNSQLRALLCSKVSMRRCAWLLRINRRTVERKLAYLAKKARLSQTELLLELRSSVTHLQFDDLITSEHSKMKPLTVSLAVDASRRIILGAEVGRIPAFGLLAERARRKYGLRANEHTACLQRLFLSIAPTVLPRALVQSDEHVLYPQFVESNLIHAQYLRHFGGRGSIAGHGELKRKAFDPLFAINHACATLRDNLARLTRRTWCTTKRVERLQQQLDVFIDFYNRQYLAR